MELFHAAFFKLCSQVSAVKPRSTSANPAPVSTMARAPTRSAATAASVLQVRWAPASCSLRHCSSIALVSRQKKRCKPFFQLVCGECCQEPQPRPLRPSRCPQGNKQRWLEFAGGVPGPGTHPARGRHALEVDLIRFILWIISWAFQPVC